MTTLPVNERVNERAEPRLQLQETIFIEVLSSTGDKDGRVIMCNSINLSANGFQVVMDNELPVDSILRLCIDLPKKNPMFLVAEVKWKRPDPDSNGFLHGFLLFESDESDIAEWRLWIAGMLESSAISF